MILNVIWDSIAGVLGALGIIAAGMGAIEIIFRPFRKKEEKRKEEKAQKEKREERIDKALDSINELLEKEKDLDKWRDNVELMLSEHSEAISMSKAERFVTWEVNRALLDGFKQQGANGRVTEAIKMMDSFANQGLHKDD